MNVKQNVDKNKKTVQNTKKSTSRIGMCMLLSMLIVLSVTSCGKNQTTGEVTVPTQSDATDDTQPEMNEAGETKGETEGETEEAKEADWSSFGEVLQSVQNAVPGTAGCSLKAAIAAGSVLDWCEDNVSLTDQDTISETVSAYLNDKEQCLLTKSEMEDTWSVVSANCNLILASDEDIKPLLDDSGESVPKFV